MAEYIDRQAVLDDLANLWDWDSVDGIQTSTALKQVITDVKNVPAADVRENVKGEWVFEKGDMVTCCDGWYCSHCKRGFHTNVPYFKDFNFCPMCGAAMEEDTCDGDSCEI